MYSEFYSPKAVNTKYAEIAGSAQRQLVGSIEKPFSGFGPDFDKGYLVALMYDQASQQLVDDRILKQVRNAAIEIGLSVITANTDYPLHSTVLDTRFTSEQPNFDVLIDSHPDLKTLGRTLSARRYIQFTDLLLGGVNGILICRQIPLQLVVARSLLPDVFRLGGHDVDPLNMDNIFHTSLFRITEKCSANSFTAFFEALEQINENLRQEPIILRTTDCYVGPNAGTIPEAIRKGW